MAKKGRLQIEKLLTNSMRNLWTTCHRRFYYRNIEGLEPIVQAPALALGSMWHEGLRAYYCSKASPEIAALHPFTNWREAIDHYFDTYVETLSQLPDQEATALAHDRADERRRLAHQLMQRYVEFWNGFDAWEILAIEQRVEMRLLTPKGNPSHWCYAGKLDLVVRDRGDDRIKVVDHKSTSREGSEGYASELGLDPQSRGYLLLINAVQNGAHVINGLPARLMDALAQDASRGLPILDFVWDVQRSKIPTQPQTLVCRGKCNDAVKNGGSAKPDCPKCQGTNVVGISQAQNVDTTPELLDAALAQYPHLVAADYADLRARLVARSGQWLYRLEQSYTPQELVDFHAECYEVTREISEAGYWTRNFAACFAPGRTCAYRHLCLTEGNEALASEARALFTQRNASPTSELDDRDGAEALPF